MTSIKNFLARGTSTSKEIQAALGLSQSTVPGCSRKWAIGLFRYQRGNFCLQPAVKNYSPLLLGADQTGLYEDLSGNFIFGEQPLLRVRRKPAAVARNDYPRLAANAVKGEPPGSRQEGNNPNSPLLTPN
ncbi:hypothetical protein [Desulfotignum balticum]|uniref:hypothetical protein n=1 Tax=Desulfotignum balticum TaxID=115781 RepID=UPI000462B74B|nr:hypothetical protein [Desulfotignum balticum]